MITTYDACGADREDSEPEAFTLSLLDRQRDARASFYFVHT